MTYDAQLKQIIKNELKSAPLGHDFPHTIRVYNFARDITKSERGADLEIVGASALLHDIAYSKGFFKEFFKREHGEVGAKISRPILYKIGFPEQKIVGVLEAIMLHNFWLYNEKNVPIETKILRDADRLDAIGYNGIIRAVAYSTYAKKDSLKSLENQLVLKDQFETKRGNELSKKKIVVVENFIKEVKKELSYHGQSSFL